jgi:hypothetical protein
METDSFLETMFSSFLFNSGRWTKSRVPVTVSVVHHFQNPLNLRMMDNAQNYGNTALLVRKQTIPTERPPLVSEF